MGRHPLKPDQDTGTISKTAGGPMAIRFAEKQKNPFEISLRTFSAHPSIYNKTRHRYTT